jgi:AcrR family transcriptional regulator
MSALGFHSYRMRVLLVSVNSHSHRSAEPRKRPIQRRSQALVERVLDEATRIFDLDGYAASTTNRIAEAAGISIGSLYQYFPNKDSILVALAERHVSLASVELERLAQRLHDLQPEPDELATIVVDVLTSFHEHDQLHRLIWHMPRSPQLQAKLDELTDAMAIGLTAHLTRFGHGEATANIRAQLIISALDGWIHTLSLTPTTSSEIRHLTATLLAP